jgi:hypothetical protein
MTVMFGAGSAADVTAAAIKTTKAALVFRAAANKLSHVEPFRVIVRIRTLHSTHSTTRPKSIVAWSVRAPLVIVPTEDDSHRGRGGDANPCSLLDRGDNHA